MIDKPLAATRRTAARSRPPRPRAGAALRVPEPPMGRRLPDGAALLDEGALGPSTASSRATSDGVPSRRPARGGNAGRRRRPAGCCSTSAVTSWTRRCSCSGGRRTSTRRSTGAGPAWRWTTTSSSRCHHRDGVRSHLWASVARRDTGPRFRVLGLQRRIREVRHGRAGGRARRRRADRAIRAGVVSPPSSGGRCRPATASQAVETEPGAYQEYYAGVAEALRPARRRRSTCRTRSTVLEVLEAARESARSGRSSSSRIRPRPSRRSSAGRAPRRPCRRSSRSCVPRSRRARMWIPPNSRESPAWSAAS